jgi:2-dehydropantoate 2-reductase
MKILIVGAGAVGGYFGARLAQAGRDVTFLVRPSRAQHLRSEGLRIVSPHGDLTLQPNLITAKELNTPFDIILLSVKAQALDQSMEDLAPAVGPDTMIYPVLNGMRHMSILAHRFGQHAILGGVCMVSTDLDEQQRIVQITPMQKLIYGELSGKITPRIRSFDDTMRNAGFETELSTSITQAMWHKWIMIASLGLVTCLLDGTIGAINAVPDGEQTILQALDECSAIGAACGFPLSPPIAAFLRQSATAKDSKLTSSMYRDLQKGVPTEVETILGDLLHHAHEHHLPTPLLQAGTVRLRVNQNARRPS